MGIGTNKLRNNNQETSETLKKEKYSELTTQKQDSKNKSPRKDDSETKRLSVTFSGLTKQNLDYLTEEQGISQVDAIRRALSTEAFLYEEIKNGSKILIKDKDNELREIIFR